METLPQLLAEQNQYQNGRSLISKSMSSIDGFSDEDISSSLRYAFVKIGIRQNQLPDTIEKSVLIDHIRRHYKMFCPDDIRMAFDLASSLKLDVDPNPFGVFSCVYLSGILNAYLKWISANPVKINYELNMEKKNTDVIMGEWIDSLIHDYKNNKLRLEFMPINVYDYLYTKKEISGTWEELKQASEIRLKELAILSEADTDSRPAYKKFKEGLENNVIIKEERESVVQIAKKIALYRYIKMICNV